ncbi:MAG: response regulator [Rhodomicrobium sp.]
MNAANNPALRQDAATVLIVEDEVLIRLALAEHFRSEGVRVIEAQNGEEALSLLGSVDAVDLVITDIRMPGAIDGVTLAKSVRRDYQLPVILVSDHYGAVLPTNSADAFFAKPYNFDTVFAAAFDLIKSAQP